VTWVVTSAPAGSLRLATARGRGSSSANHLDSLRELLLSLPNSIDEGPGVVGQHKGHSGCVGIVDITDILARGANFTQEANLLGHVAVNSFLGCLGLGTRNDSASGNTQLDRTVNLARNYQSALVASAGARAQVDSFELGSPFEFVNDPSCVKAN